MFYIKIRNFLKKFELLRKIYRKLVFPNGFPAPAISADILEASDFTPRKTEHFDDGLRLNLMIPTVTKEFIFGGITTAVHIFDELAKELHAKRRIIVTDGMDLEFDQNLFRGYSIYTCDQDSADDLQIMPYYDRRGHSFPMGKNDIFVASAWWSAYCAFPVLDWQAKAYGIPMQKMIYLVQDYEPFFYPWSTRYVMAESTYKTDYPVLAVYNTKILRDYFHLEGYKFFREYYFEPALNRKLKAYLEQHPVLQKKKQILLYGRPNTARNCFELIVTALREWVKRQPDVEEWQVLSAGETFSDIVISDKLTVKCLGKLTLDEYAKTMQESYLGVSIMVSPHPSYPPLEMSTFGIKTITNCYANKDLSGFNENIISLQHYSPRDIAEKMLELCAAYTPEGKIGYNEAYFAGTQAYEGVCRDIKAELLQAEPS